MPDDMNVTFGSKQSAEEPRQLWWGDHPRGKWRELLAAARAMVDAAPMVTSYGKPSPDPHPGLRLASAVRAFDPPKPKRHTFSGVVFEEIPHKRISVPGDWVLHDGDIYCVTPERWTSVEPVTILRPVGLERDDA